MNVLSVPFLSLVVFSFSLIWLAGARNKKWTVLLVNLLFIVLLKPSKLDAVYLVFLYLTVFVSAKMAEKNPRLIYAGVVIPVAGLCFFKYAGYFSA